MFAVAVTLVTVAAVGIGGLALVGMGQLVNKIG